jgi:hypothetical protein
MGDNSNIFFILKIIQSIPEITRGEHVILKIYSTLMDGQFFKGSICQCPIQTVCFTRNEYEKSVFLLKLDQKLLLKTEGSAIVLKIVRP